MNFFNSINMLKDVLDVIPNGTQTAGKCYNQWPLGCAPIFAKSGKGCMLKCVDNNEYIDMLAAFGPNILGYNHPQVNAAIRKQLKNGIIFSISHEIEYELAKIICDVLPSAEQVKFAKTGSDATNAAIRIARSFSNKKHIMLFDGHYHGWGDSFASASNRSGGIIDELSNYVIKARYNDLDSVECLLKMCSFAAIMLEPVSLVEPAPGFLSGLRDLCDKYGVVLIFDEVITGFRWGVSGAQGYYGVVPDLTIISKAMANGMPISAVVGKKDIMQESNKIFFSGTFFGDTLSIAASIATIKELKNNKDKIYPYIWKNGKNFKDFFINVCEKNNIDAELLGLPPRYNFKFNGKDSMGMSDLFRQEMIKRGIFIGSQFYITWAHRPKHIKSVCSAVEESINIVSNAVKNDKIDDMLTCISRSQVVFKDNLVKKC